MIFDDSLSEEEEEDDDDSEMDIVVILNENFRRRRLGSQIGRFTSIEIEWESCHAYERLL